MTNYHLRLNQRTRMLASLLGTAVLAVVACWLAVEWGYNRIYIEEGESLLLRYKGPPLPFLPGGRPPATPGQFAKVDADGKPLELGILEQLRGPGRHFYCPLWWETRRVPDQVIEPGEVAVVTSKMGKSKLYRSSMRRMSSRLSLAAELIARKVTPWRSHVVRSRRYFSLHVITL